MDWDDLPELYALLERGEIYADIHLERDYCGMAALIHAPVGWLIYYWNDYASSAHSVNPDYNGPPGAITDYLLSNGQLDEYPDAYAYPLETVIRALEHFNDTGERTPFIVWVED